MKKIVLTGGGTAGHVTPNLALVPKLRELGYEIYYIGSVDGIEKELVSSAGIPYTAVSTGKFRRYFDMKNFSDPVRVLKGIGEARAALKKIRPDVIFSKGGFVAVPVTRAAKSLGIPVVCHESDMTPGLANKLSMPAAQVICCNFPETMKDLPSDKAVLTGTPIRPELYLGDRAKALAFTGLTGKKPVLLVTGGSLGAMFINDAIRSALPDLLTRYEIVHLCGKGKLDNALTEREGYVQYEYISEELPDLLALADIVVSRAGANSICELAALRKPNLLIPLSARASRGDQILNARSFEQQGFSMVLEEEEVTTLTLLEAVDTLYRDREKYISAMKESAAGDAVSVISEIIDRAAKKR